MRSLSALVLLALSACTPDASIFSATTTGDQYLHLPAVAFGPDDMVELRFPGYGGRATSLVAYTRPHGAAVTTASLQCTTDGEAHTCRLPVEYLAPATGWETLTVLMQPGRTVKAGRAGITDVAQVCSDSDLTGCSERLTDESWQCHGKTAAGTTIDLSCSGEPVLPVVDVMVTKAQPELRKGIILPAPNEVGDLLRVRSLEMPGPRPNLGTVLIARRSYTESTSTGERQTVPQCTETATLEVYGWSGDLSPQDVIGGQAERVEVEVRPDLFSFATFGRHHEHHAIRMTEDACISGWRAVDTDERPASGLWHWGSVSSGTWSDFAAGGGSPQPLFRTAPDTIAGAACGRNWGPTAGDEPYGTACSPLISPCDCPPSSCRPFGDHWVCAQGEGQ